ncbi:hypothetical protein [Sphingobium tyrosinilyticum]|uniref:Uncharacterized protein n=1 Tax=Sphingobium tyrosinilyticum TaxID=2715436 RepID=A0ABV9EY36_9SPHN
MSARFWLFSMASAGAALAGGLALGLYATTPPRIAFTDAEIPYSAQQESASQPDVTGLSGPTDIKCQGCGPTLADRQMAVMMGGGWSGYDDPAVRDYMAQEYSADDDAPLPQDYEQPTPVRLPANIERFAAGESDGSQPVQIAQGSVATASPVTATSY